MREKRGTGITAYTKAYEEISPKEARGRLLALADELAKGQFRYYSREARHLTAALLKDDDGKPVNPHSKIGFARDIQGDLSIADKLTKEGKADEAAAFAFTAETKWATMIMKFSWEDDALRGEKVAGGARNSAHQTNTRHAALRERRFARIEHLLSTGLNADSAFATCEVEGLGKATAIKRQWHRHAQSRDT